MSLKANLILELNNRADCVQADYERLIIAGANRDALERIIKHSIEIGAIKDKLINLETHDLLEGTDE